MAESLPRLSVVVPTRNESDSLGPLWDRLGPALSGIAAEVCFVDDSDDDTPSLLARLESAQPMVRCLIRRGEQRQGGLSTAVVSGLHMARGEYVCVMDADLQHSPELIPAMLAAADAGADVVVASRYLRGGSPSGLSGRFRHLVSRGASLVARALFGEARQSTDPLSGFFLCRRRLVDGIEFRPVGFKILLELLVCIPGVRVQDVPLEFQPRAAGVSKASARQGVLFLRHLASLFFQVDGSARTWKFGLVGLSGLGIFLPSVWALTGPGGVAPPLAFLPAFALSFTWNTLWNRAWTFADQRRRAREGAMSRFVLRALVANLVVMYPVFALLCLAGLVPLASGAIAAAAGMLANGLVNRRSTRLAPSIWGQVAADAGVQLGLARLARAVSADRAVALPPDPGAMSSSVPPEVLARIRRSQCGAIWTESSSHRPQRRRGIDLTSQLLLPVVDGRRLTGIVVCERRATRPFDAADLETGLHAIDELVDALAGAGLRSPVSSGSRPVSTEAGA
ncbi:MAG TPA: glycosyltransferase [Candidatus Binatia bacterium]|nr:glycosyltransferase [Candidatus Binatia bacterium]